MKVVACAFLFLMYLRNLSNTVVDLDLWHQMASFREALLLGHIPVKDTFAYTPTVFPSVNHEWGAGAIAYFLATQFGASGILVAKYSLALMLVVLLILCIKRRSVSIVVLLFLVPIGILLIQGGFSTIRPQMYSLVFLACLLYFFELDRNGNSRWIAAWIPLFLIWINLHGGFLVGLGLLGTHWLEQMLRRRAHVHLVLLGTVMVGLIALNPYGIDYYPYLWRAMTMPRPYIKEWEPIWSGSDLLYIIIFLMSFIPLIYSVRRIGIRNSDGIALVLTTGLASVFCTRLVMFYAIVWTVYVSGYIERTPLREIMNGLCKRFSKILILILCVVTIGFFLRTLSYQPWKLLVPIDHIKKYGDHPVYPVGPVEYISAIGFKGNLMVHFNWGSYVTWKLYPDIRVSMDSRYETAYPEWLVDENIRFYKAENGWQSILTKYPTDLVLVHKRLPLAKVLPQQSEWKKVYSDHLFELYARPGLLLPVVNLTDRFFTGVFP